MEKLKSKLNYYKEKGCNLNSEEVKKILYELENTQSDLYEANNRINDLLDIVEHKYEVIELMAEQLTTPVHNKEWVIEYFEERCK